VNLVRIVNLWPPFEEGMISAIIVALAPIGAVEGQTFVSGVQFGAGQVYVSGSIEGQVMVAGQQSGALYG